MRAARKRTKAEPFRFRYLPEHVPWIEEQLWQARDHGLEILDAFSRFEHDQVALYIGEPEVVLDVGCGLGRAAVYLNAALGLRETHFILADGTGDRVQTRECGWAGFGQRVYNDMRLTESFCHLNGLHDFETLEMVTGDWGRLPHVDLVISHCAAGMHFPIEEVMPKLLGVAREEVTMIFGTRNRERYHEDSFRDRFRQVWFLKEEEVPPFPRQDWLILRHRRESGGG